MTVENQALPCAPNAEPADEEVDWWETAELTMLRSRASME
jgi:hypothetical protein